MLSAEFRQALCDLDVALLRKLWAHVAPGMPQPQSDEEVLTTAHYARTAARSVPFRLRAYSHCWLVDHGLPSGLPDRLRPKAQRLYPRIVDAVGVSVKAFSAAGVPLAKAIEKAMSDAVAEMYADGIRDPELVRARMDEARRRIMAS